MDWCYMFLKVKKEKQKFDLKTLIGNAWNLDFHGGKLLLLRTLWCNFHMFLDILENWKQRTNFPGKLF